MSRIFHLATRTLSHARRPGIPFDTYRFVRQLEKAGLSRRQSVAIMMAMDTLLKSHSAKLSSHILTTQELETETYSYKTHLQEQRNELQLLKLNESASLRSESESLTRDLEKLSQKFAEMTSSLKAEINLDLNNHKADGREIGTEIDLRTQQVLHKLIVKMSTLKTSLETIKVELTRDIVCMLF